MLKRKIVLCVLGIVTALTLYVGMGFAADTFGYDTTSVSACSGGNVGGGC
ncbi:MAG: hypothetical protein AAF702_37595 [Chloroflexota bacterium]